MKLPFFGGAYQGRSKSVNAERCVNLYLEKQGDQWILVGTPGLTSRVELSQGPVRGMHLFDDEMIVVAGTGVYSVNSNHVATSLGSITTTNSRVSMANNGLQVVLVDGSSTGYYYDGTTFAAITDADFSGGIAVAEQDGYFIVAEPDSGRLRISDLYTATSWIDSDFATAEGAPDNLRGILSDHREIWLPGVVSTEVWYNSGDSDFPFSRIPSGFLEKGIAAGFTLTKHDNSVLWLGADERGQGVLIEVGGGYQARIVSPVGINWQWSQYTTISDAFAFTYQVEGHEFYVITFPTENATWVYDAATKEWHQWSSNIDGNTSSRHRSNCHCFAFGRHYVGDYQTGTIYSIEPDVYTEDGEAIIRDRIGQHAIADEERLPIASVQIAFEEGTALTTGQGSDPQAMLRWSKDGGRTWGNELWRSIGTVGQYRARAVWRKLGIARQWTFWLRMSDPVKWIVRDALAKGRE